MVAGVTVAQQQAVDRLDHVAHEVETVDDVDGVGRALADAFGVAAVAVAHRDFDARMLPQPVGHDRDRAIGQQIDHPARFQVDEHRAERHTPPEGEVVQAEHARRGHLWLR